MTAPLIAFAIPLLDTALAIARRFLRHQALFIADRGHIHHRLLSRGFTPRRVAYILYVSAGLFACLSILLTTGTYNGGLILVAFCVAVGIAIHYLGYEEFESVRRVIFGGTLRRALNADIHIRQLESSIHSANSVDDCWAAVQVAGKGLGFSRAALFVGPREFCAELVECDDTAECWSLTVPLNSAGRIDLRIPFHQGRPLGTVAPLARSLRVVLAPKLENLMPKSTAATGGNSY
jgi:UDP-GlcNAc:undecaprenyl-phosphate GlcNAc-1-phosphate transferase